MADAGSMRPDRDVSYVFVIDTDTYAGNFEREMTAFCTGQVGECGKGRIQAEDFSDDREEGLITVDFSDVVVRRPDDNGHMRPTAIWPMPGRINDGMGNCSDGEHGPGKWPAYESVAIFFGERPSPEMVAVIKDRAASFAAAHAHARYGSGKPIGIKGFRLLRETVTRTVEEIPAS